MNTPIGTPYPTQPHVIVPIHTYGVEYVWRGKVRRLHTDHTWKDDNDNPRDQSYMRWWQWENAEEYIESEIDMSARGRNTMRVFRCDDNQ